MFNVLISGLQRMTVSQLSALFQTRLTDLQQLIARTPNIPKNIQDILYQELRKLAQDFNEQQRKLQHDFDQVLNERDDLERRLRAVTKDRDRIADNNDNLEKRIKDMKLKHKRSMDRVDEIELRWKRINESLVDQVRIQEEQLKGKRALWLDANPESSARRSAMTAIRDPYDSPSASHSTSFAGGLTGSMNSSSITSPVHNTFSFQNLGAPQIQLNNAGRLNPSHPNRPGPRRRPAMGTLPTGPALPGTTIYTNTTDQSFRRTYPTEPGSPRPSNALVLRQKEDDLAIGYQAAIEKLYVMVEDWVKKFSNIPNPKNDRLIASGNDILWDYMMNCTYPGHRQDSHTHVTTLLNDVLTRYWFVMRMATQYCVKDIMSVSAFKPYSTAVAKTLEEIEKKLQERGLSRDISIYILCLLFLGLNNEVRQKLIDKQSETVQSVVSAKNYPLFRAAQLNHHTKRLRDMLGPMLNDGVERAQAGKDLGALAVHAWELSVKMHTAYLTFQVYFPETASKFTAATMHSKDNPHADPMQLQIQQTRLKLVITPVITMRDDRGTTIKAKNLHTSNVLLMN